MLLAGELEGAGHGVLPWVGRRGRQGGGGVPAQHGRLRAVETLLRDRVGERQYGGQFLVVDLDRGGTQPGGLEGVTEDPAHGMADEHDLSAVRIREQRFIVLRPGVIHPGHIGRGEDADHTGDVVGGVHPQVEDAGMGVRRLHRVGVEDAGMAVDQVIGVQGGTGDVPGGGLVGVGLADHRVGGTLRQGTHAGTSCVSAKKRSSDVPSIAVRYAELAR